MSCVPIDVALGALWDAHQSGLLVEHESYLAAANKIKSLSLNDWVTRVLDAWADETEICATPTPAPNLVGQFTVDVGGRYFHGVTREMARLAAALAAYAQLPPTECARLGKPPIDVPLSHLSSGSK